MDWKRLVSSSVASAFLASLAFAGVPFRGHKVRSIEIWLTTPTKTALFAKQEAPASFVKARNSNPTITVNDGQKFQTIDGFGWALTGGSAQHLIHMDAAHRAAILKELFATDGNNLGVSYLRLSVGASDLNDHVFTYDDMPAGETDPQLQHFDLGPDRTDVIPVMKEILKINPDVKVLASPWTAPSWMKTNGDPKGGKLKPECYDVYARYWVKYLESMKAEGIHIDTLTVQNEPLNPKNTPSMVMLAPEEADFIKNHLGPELRKASLDTKIVLYDHNCDVPEYATSILADPEAAQYVDGSGFHLYGGTIDAMSRVHDAFPNKNLYFTEQMVTGSVEEKDAKPWIDFAEPVASLIVGATRNWSRNVLLWNLAANSQNEPHTNNGGCTMCQGAITIDGNDVSRNRAYYTVAHASKFVRPGSVRIGSTPNESLANVAFQTPDGHRVLIVANTGKDTQAFNIRYHGKMLPATLVAGAVATYIF